MAPTDEQLLQDALRDGEAFGEFYRRHAPTLLGYLTRRVGDAEVAADLTAETFAAALEGLPRFKPDLGPATAWLYGIARHKLARTFERGRVEDDARRKLDLPRISVDDDALERIEAFAASESTGRLINELLETLPSEQQHAVTARVVHEREYAEIAGTHNTSETVIRKRVSRALARLRSGLEHTP
ncbi:RNA polymerase sigma factor [Solirubrobacter ginsenosidimutans]|uniref:RNA polymerase sigma factor n=1 Tax=Solirubrobacter ginsenosidimutans TaxID=490573 RepID=A0A9X3MUG8_9ACTN|nr:RNA polymerase sigma factor [Solirubrobacter ginsenosidimutans]MDA0162849.1 RNA polymerase sigma factor [Solirubrobacter ginsenosidimutans]